MRQCVVHADYEHLREWVERLPDLFEQEAGELIYRGRNELRRFQEGGLSLVVKSFQIPHLLNRVVYGFLRPSKAQRSYDYALLLQKAGFGTPAPVAWLTESKAGLLGHSYYVSLQSECPHTYAILMDGQHPEQERYLKAIARFTARLHDKGMIHKDYSLGNLLLKDTGTEIHIELIDLNRIRFRKHISAEEGCRNLFDGRLPATRLMREIMAEAYAEARGLNIDECRKWIDVCEAEQQKK